MIRPPFLISESFADYNAARARYITSSMVVQYSRSPILCTMPNESTAAMDVGTAAHKYILEGPKAFEAEYVVGGPINPKTGTTYGRATKAFEEWLAARPGVGVVSDEELAMIQAMDSSLRSHALIAPLLLEGCAEGTVRAEYYGAPCQIRIDWLSAGGTICDLKTCEVLEEFRWNIRKFGYAQKASFYQQVYRAAAKDFIEPDYRLIVVEKNPPYRSALWMFPDEALQAIHAGARGDIAGIIESRRTGNWPTGYESIQIAEVE